MDYRRLGNTGLQVSELCFGCMSFGSSSWRPWVLEPADAEPFFRRALDAGINFFDTANAYSAGSSEEIVGRLLGELTNRDEVVIATKVYFPMRRGRNARGLSRKAILTELEHSLRRLGTDYIDLYQIHRFDDRTPVEETMAALDAAVTSGKVRYIGASSMWAWQFATMQFTAESAGTSRFVSMQNHYSLLHREEEREMHPLLLDRGVGTMPWSPLGRGKLTRPWGTTTVRSESDPSIPARADDDLERPIVEALEGVAAERGVPMAQVAMAWVLRNPVVASPIVGAGKLQHVDDAVAALDIELSDDAVAALEAPYSPRPSLC